MQLKIEDAVRIETLLSDILSICQCEYDRTLLGFIFFRAKYEIMVEFTLRDNPKYDQTGLNIALLMIEEDIKKIFKNKGLDLWFEVKCQDTVLKLGLKETLSDEEVNMCITWLKMTGLINGFTS